MNDMNAQNILVVDDNKDLVLMIKQFLKKFGYTVISAFDGDKALSIAQTFRPDLILLDILMPKLNGYDVCIKLRESFETSIIPVIMLSERDKVVDKVAGLNSGADDYLPKPFDMWELKARIERILKRNNRTISLNPLTRLPGNISIEEEVRKRIASKELFSFSYIDIDNFKAYNDNYGYQKGDEVIKLTSDIILNALRNFGGKKGFLGHVGGDDFVCIAHPEQMEKICTIIAEQFDCLVLDYYTREDREKGFITTHDRRGELHSFPIMTLSIGMVSNEKRSLDHYAKVVEIASEMKRYVKSLPERQGSIFRKDRRTN